MCPQGRTVSGSRAPPTLLLPLSAVLDSRVLPLLGPWLPPGRDWGGTLAGAYIAQSLACFEEVENLRQVWGQRTDGGQSGKGPGAASHAFCAGAAGR